MSDVTANAANQQQQEPVDRSRRSQIVSRTIAALLASSFVLTALTGSGYFNGPNGTVNGEEIVSAYVSGAIYAAGAALLAYITGSSIDYNGGIRNMWSSRNASYSPAQTYLPSQQYVHGNDQFMHAGSHAPDRRQGMG